MYYQGHETLPCSKEKGSRQVDKLRMRELEKDLRKKGNTRFMDKELFIGQTTTGTCEWFEISQTG